MKATNPARCFGIIDLATQSPMPQVPVIVERPVALTLTMPLPPSVNTTAGTRLGSSHPKVQAWQRNADAHLLWTKQSKQLRLIAGPFEIEIAFDRVAMGQLDRRGVPRRGDLDNRLKYLFDYLERLHVIENDGLCEGLTVGKGRVPDGCRVRLWPWDWQGLR
jgi:Holliday junction resolvase RusA-like endonuclease